MRPRHLCLGCGSTCVAMGSGSVSFNEAEASLPRMPCKQAAGQKPRSAGFNEAEASLPRMPKPPARRPQRGSCFNEAEASLPRMPRLEDARLSGRLEASMRPRHLCLGCRMAADRARIEEIELQ